MRPPPARATSPTENSDSILVSFDSRWTDLLKSKTNFSFIRKRLPVSIVPRYVYIYCKSPISSIIGKAEVSQIGFVPVSEAVREGNRLSMTHDEITKYCSGQETIGLCRLENLVRFSHPLNLASICQKLDFTPPQSFVILSKHAVISIEELARD